MTTLHNACYDTLHNACYDTLHNAASPPRGSTGILRAGGGGSTGGTEEAGDGATSAQAEAVTPLLGPLEAEDLPISPPVSPHVSDP